MSACTASAAGGANTVAHTLWHRPILAVALVGGIGAWNALCPPEPCKEVNRIGPDGQTVQVCEDLPQTK